MHKIFNQWATIAAKDDLDTGGNLPLEENLRNALNYQLLINNFFSQFLFVSLHFSISGV
jgi:hypothetical protein